MELDGTRMALLDNSDGVATTVLVGRVSVVTL